jgi:uncharacterized protein (TIRG00374 family)
LRVSLTAAALVLLLIVIHPADLFASIQRIAFDRFVIMVALAVLAHFLAVVRWRLFVPGQSFSLLGQLYCTSVLVGAVLPGQIAGDAARVVTLGRTATRIAPAAMSVVADRIVGLGGILIVACLGAVVSESAPVSVRYALLLLTIGLFVGVPLINYGISSHAWQWQKTIAGRLPRVEGLLEQLAGFASGVTRQRLVGALLLGVLFQLACVGMSVAGASSFSIDLALADWCWLFGVISIALVLPITVGGLGLREGGFALLLDRFGVPADQAVALSLAVFVAGLIPAMLGALVLNRGRRDKSVAGPTSHL